MTVLGMMTMRVLVLTGARVDVGMHMGLVLICPAQSPNQICQAESDKEPRRYVAAGRFDKLQLFHSKAHRDAYHTEDNRACDMTEAAQKCYDNSFGS